MMFGDRIDTFLIACFVLAVVIVSGCSATLGNKAFTYKDPVADSDIHVDIYNPDKAWKGTTLLADNHRRDRSRIIEVNMQGRIVWAWYARDHFNKPPYKDIYDEGWTHTNAASRLPNGNTLVTASTRIVEFTPQGEIAWQLKLIGVNFRDRRDRSGLGIYKAERIAPQ
jgi:phage terminase large subunit-like protein